MIATSQRPATIRVAIYTRKSVSEGLDQEFNTLEAQREAVEAYVASQRGEGWAALPDRYDDGGFSGANTDRPGFQQLMRDVEAGKVDIVAVYKIDRLSRSLLDFTQLLATFRRHGVSFVSVTQSFDTSTSMGRMVVNLLATFAEFERETIAERVRDKMRASRRRGMWTGGRPPLGYDVVDRRLVVNEQEAERVRAIFDLYLEAGSLLPAVRELDARGWTSKSWTKRNGRVERGRRFTKTSLHVLLTNPVYLGRMRCGGAVVDGQHEAILDQETWDEAQAHLSRKATTPRGWRPPGKSGAILGGLLFCGACGKAMNSHSTRRNGRRYGYYVCARALKKGASTCPGSRAPAGELEAFVFEQIRSVGRDQRLLEAALDADRADREAKRPALDSALRKATAEQAQLREERHNLVRAIAEGATSLVEPLAEVDARLAEANRRALGARYELDCLDMDLVDSEELRRALGELEPVWAELFPKERARALALLLERIEFDPESGEVATTFRRGGPGDVQAEARRHRESPPDTTTCAAPGTSPNGRQANPKHGEPNHDQDPKP